MHAVLTKSFYGVVLIKFQQEVCLSRLTHIKPLNIISKTLNYVCTGKQSNLEVCFIRHFHNFKVATWFCNPQEEVSREIFGGSSSNVAIVISTKEKNGPAKFKEYFFFKFAGGCFMVRFANLHWSSQDRSPAFSVITA